MNSWTACLALPLPSTPRATPPSRHFTAWGWGWGWLRDRASASGKAKRRRGGGGSPASVSGGVGRQPTVGYRTVPQLGYGRRSGAARRGVVEGEAVRPARATGPWAVIASLSLSRSLRRRRRDPVAICPPRRAFQRRPARWPLARHNLNFCPGSS